MLAPSSAGLCFPADSFLYPKGDGGGGKAELPSPMLLAKPSLFLKSPQTQTAGLVHKGPICI